MTKCGRCRGCCEKALLRSSCRKISEMTLERGEHAIPPATSSVNQVLWEHGHAIRFYLSILSPMAELSNRDTDHLGHKA